MDKFTLFWCFLYVLNVVHSVSVDYSAVKEWNSFKTEFSKSYKSKAEEESRFKAFMENKRLIDRHNEKFRKGEVTFEMGLNDFSDLGNQEFAKMMKLDMPIRLKDLKDAQNNTIFYETPYAYKAPSGIDWRNKGAVTHVKNQGGCGSCWAFSAIGALEGQHFRKNKKLVSLSAQHLVDCAIQKGCDGGWASTAFQYVKKHGIATADSYPYKARDGNCRHDRENTSGLRITGYKSIRSGDEEALKNAVATIGPISISINVRRSFQNYRGGIYYEPKCSSTYLGHAVLLIGYGTENGQDYWLIKNSWGEGWGIKGYGKMVRNKRNNCGIATRATYPLV